MEPFDFSQLAHLQLPVAGDSDFANAQYNAEVYAAVAVANGLDYQRVSLGLNAGTGTLFTVCDSKQFANVLSGSLANMPFELFHFSGKIIGHNDKRSMRQATVLKFTLPRTLPHLVIDAHLDVDNPGSVLPIFFDKNQRIIFEGDFSKYFAVYAPRTYEQSAVNILAPDIMEALLKHAAFCDIEIVDNYLYFYWPGHIYTPQDMQRIFATAHEIVVELKNKLTRSDIYGKPEQKALHEQGEGVRLQRGVAKGAIALIVIIVAGSVLGAIFFGDSEKGYNFSLLLLLIAVLIYRTYTSHKKRQLKKELDQRNKIL